MRKYYMILDCETAVDSSIIDIAAVIYTRQSLLEGGDPRHLKEVNRFAVLLNENWGKVELFHDVSNAGIWSKKNLAKRNQAYTDMLIDGRRTLASVAHVNKWIAQAVACYGDALELTAYNLAFDLDKCNKQGIDLSSIKNRFCLWQASLGTTCATKGYKNFCLENHYFTNRTQKTGHSGIQTSAETVSHYVSGLDLKEPHTALEDVTEHESVILEKVLGFRGWREKSKPYVWRDWAVRDAFTAK